MNVNKSDVYDFVELISHVCPQYSFSSPGFPTEAATSHKYIAQFSSLILEGLQDFSISPRRPFVFTVLGRDEKKAN